VPDSSLGVLEIVNDQTHPLCGSFRGSCHTGQPVMNTIGTHKMEATR